jgi:hypothetical protein
MSMEHVMSGSVQALVVGLLIAAPAGLALVGTAPAAAVVETPVETGCPAGYELVSVASLEAAGPYLAPRRFDTAGNNNGYVCAHVRPDSVRDAFCAIAGGNACNLAQLGLPIYLWTDDDNPALR